jgi:hypothetical protein
LLDANKRLNTAYLLKESFGVICRQRSYAERSCFPRDSQ